jgi:hypothetical protein
MYLEAHGSYTKVKSYTLAGEETASASLNARIML